MSSPRRAKGSSAALRDALDLVAKRAPGTILRFGGHAYAAGLSLAEEALPRFAVEFERVAREALSPAMLERTLETDGELADDELTIALARDLACRVWGQGFPAPIFEGEFRIADQRVVGDKHGRLVFALGGGSVNAIAFDDPGPFPPRIYAAYRPDIHHYQGLLSLQIVIESWRPA